MRINPTFVIMLTVLATTGSWGLWQIVSNNANQAKPAVGDTNTSLPKHQNTVHSTNVADNSEATKNSKTFDKDITHVRELLLQDQFTLAVTYIEERYSDLSSEELAVYKTLFINMGLVFSDNGNLKKAQRLYLTSSPLFEGVEILDSLASVSIELNDWKTAFDALLKSSLLESRPEVISTKLTNLSSVASKLKSDLLTSSDLESARQLYQLLYESHPSYAQFQLELAFIHLELENINEAKQLLNAIQYDLGVGNIAQKQLALLETQAPSITENKPPQKPNKRNSDISVSLVRSGNSFLVDSAINGKKARLLLDTGASITALSPELISRSRLSPTGQVVRLSTANGITESKLFLAKKITLGRVTIHDLVVAEINLGNSQHFQGLLGTDLLNKVGSDYSYLIDNENSALIFRRTRR